MINVVIADDHPIVREGLKQILSDCSEITIVDEAGSGAELLEKLSKTRCDVLLLDINMPGRSGIDILSELKSRWPKLAILMLSAYPEEQYAIRALKTGASGYLVKKSAPDELILAIRKVSGGGRYVSSSLAEKLAFGLEDDNKGPIHERFSEREYQVFYMIASGKTVSEIADDLSLSVKTISTYRTRILEKMNMKNNSELVRYAVKNGIVE